jgi:hypothetical protein
MFLLLLFSLYLAQSSQWTDNSINTISGAKACLHDNYRILFDALFKTMPRHSKVKDHVEAQTLDQMGSLLRTGISFCAAYDQLIPWVSERLQFHQYWVSDPKKPAPQWLEPTIKYLGNATELSNECRTLDNAIPPKDKKKHSGVRSDLFRCIKLHSKYAAMTYFLEQYND